MDSLFIPQRLYQVLFESQKNCEIVQFKLLRWKSKENIVSLKSENKGDMTTIELKKQLTDPITLTEDQRQEIEESQKQVEAGEFIEQEELDQKFNQWQNL